jgi:hypothetical protein
VYALKLGHVAYSGPFEELMNDTRKLDAVLALAHTADVETDSQLVTN